MLARYPDELSGGQQQRVGVARALAADPPVLLMDEPFGAVDPIVRSRLQDELLNLQERLHKTIVLVTHDIDEALKLADRIALLNVGGVLEQYASPDELLRAPANAFVEQFVGDDRGVKRLQLSTVSQLPFEQGPVVDVGTPFGQARTVLREYRSDWLGLVDDGRFVGWVDGSDLREGVDLGGVQRYPPVGSCDADQHLAQRDGGDHELEHLGGGRRRRGTLRGSGHPRSHPCRARAGRPHTRLVGVRGTA